MADGSIGKYYHLCANRVRQIRAIGVAISSGIEVKEITIDKSGGCGVIKGQFIAFINALTTPNPS